MRSARLSFALGAILAATLVAAPVAAAPNARSTLGGSAPSWAKPANFAGPASPSAHLGFRVYLGWNDASGAAALARAVSDPASSSYRHYVTAAQFRSRFAPTPAQVGAVQSWLASQGFTIDYTPANNHYVAAEGTVAQASAAFGTSFGMYRVRGLTVRAPSSDVSIPSSLAGVVSGVMGLDESAAFVAPDHIVDSAVSAGFRNAPPLSDYWQQLESPYAFPSGFTSVTDTTTATWTVRGYTPAQVKGAYGISGYTGAGQRVAIIDAYASPTILADVNQWSTNRGLPTMNSSQLIQVLAPGTYNMPDNRAQSPSGWFGEETLDVEAVHGMAPAATIVYVGAPNNYADLDAAMNDVVDNHLASIVTNSYGYSTELLPEGYVKPFEDTLIQAAAEGIGVYFSSGDNGDETQTMGYATPDWPASSPWVTAVGGTSIGIDSNNDRAIETGWGTSNYSCNKTTLVCSRTGWLYGAGGGTSRLFAKPWYQSALSTSGRAVPDVAALADPQTGYLIGQTQAFPNGTYYDEYRIGGTSLASPIFAGLMALAQQANDKTYGFANPVFYANAGSFYDVTSHKTAVARRNYVNGVDSSNGTSDKLRTFDDYSGSTTQSTETGWDNVTGLGTPSGIFSH